MLQSVRGTKDILPDVTYKWQYAERICREISSKFGFKELRTPAFEKTEVFSRSIGENTDIVNKEMYTFEDRGGESMTLRPEMTAALVRSVIQHSLDRNRSATRLWYFGPFFRYERPQKGRQRQFHQYGAELISSPYPEADIEIIMLANDLIRSLGINEYKLKINTLGNDKSRLDYRNALVEYLKANKADLSKDSQVRLEANPLRVLDSKDKNDQKIIENAPVILEYLDEESSEHYEKVKSSLQQANVDFEAEPKLVRGLDYYCHTVFEFQSDILGAQDSFGGGGRYDGLFEQMGGKPTPAIGFAMGVERLMIMLEEIGALPDQKKDADVFIVIPDAKFTSAAMEVATKLREKGISVVTELQRRSMKAQFKESNKMNVSYNIIFGEEEFKRDAVNIKDMDSGEQSEHPYKDIETFNFCL